MIHKSELGLMEWRGVSHLGAVWLVCLGGAVVKNPLADSAVLRGSGLNPGLGRSPGLGRNGNSLQYSYLGNPKDRGAWQGYSPRSRGELDKTE